MEDRGITITTAPEEQVEQAQENVQDVAPEHTHPHNQKLYDLVDEILEVVKPRLNSGELSPWEVMEALSVATSGMVISLVPPKELNAAQREADSLSRYMLKQFDTKSNKKKMMFVSQLLGASKMTSYVMAHGARMMETYNMQAKKAGAQQLKELLKDEQN